MNSKFGIVLFAIMLAPAFAVSQSPVPTDKPRAAVSYGFVIDNSGSYRPFLERVILLANRIAERNGEHDEAFLVTFVDKAKTVIRQELTSNNVEIRDAAENMYVEGGTTAILDAVRLSVDYLATNARDEPNRQKAIVLVSDGDDRGSAATIAQVIALAKNAKIKIIVVGMSDEKLNKKLLDRLAKESGGTAFYPTTTKEMAAVVDSIAAALRSTSAN